MNPGESPRICFYSLNRLSRQSILIIKANKMHYFSTIFY